MMVDCREAGGGVVPGADGTLPPSMLREQFAKVCFETLLQFSLVEGISSPSALSPGPEAAALTAPISGGDDPAAADAELITGKLAVTALLHRFQEVVEKFCHDQNLTGKCPLPRLIQILTITFTNITLRTYEQWLIWRGGTQSPFFLKYFSVPLVIWHL